MTARKRATALVPGGLVGGLIATKRERSPILSPPADPHGPPRTRLWATADQLLWQFSEQPTDVTEAVTGGNSFKTVSGLRGAAEVMLQSELNKWDYHLSVMPEWSHKPKDTRLKEPFLTQITEALAELIIIEEEIAVLKRMIKEREDAEIQASKAEWLNYLRKSKGRVVGRVIGGQRVELPARLPRERVAHLTEELQAWRAERQDGVAD